MFKRNIFKMVCGIFLGVSSLFAANLQSNYSVAVELARAEKVDSLVKRINELQEYIKIYIYNTGDLAPTKAKINTYSQVLGSAAWQNYDGNSLTLDFSKPSSVIFGNLFTVQPSNEVLAFLTHSSDLNPLANIDKNKYAITIPFSATLSSFLKATEKLKKNNKVEISQKEPIDTSKTWYKPNGYGGYDIYAYDSTVAKWQQYGSMGFDKEGGFGNNSNIVVKSINTLGSMPAIAGSKAYVSKGSKASEYVYDGEKWVTSSSASTSGNTTILEMATTGIDEEVDGSQASASDPYNGVKSTFAGTKRFTKKGGKGGGYWHDNNNNFIVVSKMADLVAIANLRNYTIAFLPNISGDRVHVLQKINNRWWYIADNYNDVVLNMDNAKYQKYCGSNCRVFDKANKQYFKFNGVHAWNSINSDETRNYIVSLTFGTRKNFPAPLKSTTAYYTLDNDCSSSTCNGSKNTAYYAGLKVNNMFAFYYFPGAKKASNYLTDAIPRDTIFDMYSKKDQISILKSTSELFARDEDSKYRPIYRKLDDDTFYSKMGVKIPDELVDKNKKVHLPRDPYSASNVVISSNSINFGSNLDDFDGWEDAPNFAKVILNGRIYTHVKNDHYDFWTTATLKSSSLTLKDLVPDNSTIYGISRLTVPRIPNDKVKVYTMQLCKEDRSCPKSNPKEPRYTSNGVFPKSDFKNRYKWFYSSKIDSRIINNLLDNPCIQKSFKASKLTASKIMTIDLSKNECYVQYPAKTLIDLGQINSPNQSCGTGAKNVKVRIQSNGTVKLDYQLFVNNGHKLDYQRTMYISKGQVKTNESQTKKLFFALGEASRIKFDNSGNVGKLYIGANCKYSPYYNQWEEIPLKYCDQDSRLKPIGNTICEYRESFY